MNKSHLALAVRRERRKMGMSRAELAQCLNVAESTIWRWEHEISMIGMEKWGELLSVLKAFDDSMGAV